jgi:hypothetical protein
MQKKIYSAATMVETLALWNFSIGLGFSPTLLTSAHLSKFKIAQKILTKF